MQLTFGGRKLVAFGFALFRIAASVRGGTPPLPVISNQVFIVTNTTFAGGAYGDGISNNTAAIQSAINFATSHGGGTVLVPAVPTLGTYLSGPISLASHVNLQIDAGATLKMLPMSSWPGATTFINAGTITDVEISGSGTIDGNAGFGSTNWWGPPAASSRPNFVQFIRCTRSMIKDVTLQNPPTFHLMLKNNNVSLTVQDIIIKTPSNSPNTDGMDLGSTNVLIQGCSISDGDDNIQIGSSSALCSDITISNCTFGTGHGVSIGSPTQSGINNLIVSNCVWNGTQYGIKIKTDRGIGGLIQNLKYTDLTMSNVNFAIAFYLYYSSVGSPSSSFNVSPFRASTDTVHTVTSTTPMVRNITISNLTASALGGNIAGIIWGLPESLISNVTMSKVNISAPTKTFCVYNASGIEILDSNLTAPNTTTNTLTIYNAQIIVTNTFANPNLVTLGGLAKPPTNNVLAVFNGRATITDTNMLGTGPITLGSSTLTLSQASVNSSNTPISIVGSSTLAFTSGTNTLDGSLSGPGALTLNLPASTRLALRGDSSGFGGTLVVSNSGTLFVNNTVGGGTGTGAVTVLSGAKLGGTGTIGGPLTVNGTLAPGNSPGTLTMDGDAVVNGAAVLQYELGTSGDLLAVSGNLTLAGTLNVADSGGFTNTTYTLFTYGGSLTYNGLSLGALPSGYSYTIDTNTRGEVDLVVTSTNLSTFQQWQIQYFGSTNNPSADPDLDPDGDGQDNQAEFQSGTNPTNSASALQIISEVRQTTDVIITWTTAGGHTNGVQATLGGAGGNYNTNFVDISSPIIISGSGDMATNYVDVGGGTNNPSRYYRIRLVP